MGLNVATRLGPYEVLAPIGAGGMGEVYRAHDTRLDREVALKILPASVAADAERLARFEREARAAAALSHPNLLAVFDIGMQQGVPYIISELLNGETLRERLRGGPIPQRKATEYAMQMARGLAAAHGKGVVHRDLKPENVFVTTDGRVKILDFGLAKLALQERPAGESAPTLSLATRPGQVMGTPGYIAPEQLRGQEADLRSDIFAVGAILYEMLSGRRAFHGETSIETLNATLHEDPLDAFPPGRPVSPALERVVRHCLEKSPAERFQSAQDLAFALESAQVPSDTGTAAVVRRTLPRRVWKPAVGAALLIALLLAAFLAGRRTTAVQQPSFHRLTYRRGTIREARFTPDGQNIVYGAAWDGRPWEVFSTRCDSADSRPLGLDQAQVLAVSPRGELALMMGPRRVGQMAPWNEQGTLATVPLAGGAPREWLAGVAFADWNPDGSELAVIRSQLPQHTSQVEYPRGKPIYRGADRAFYNVRISRAGYLLAFFDSAYVDDYARVVVVDRGGKKRLQSRVFTNMTGLAWSANGGEVWFTAASPGGSRALYAIDLSGRERLVLRVPAWLTLKDISRDGRVLLAKDTENWGIMALAPGRAEERDLSWYSWSILDDISADGGKIVFSEGGEAGEDRWGVYLRDIYGGPAVRLGDGVYGALSPDGKWVLSLTQYREGSRMRLIVLPTGAGETRQLTRGDSDVERNSFGWLPDSSAVVYGAGEEGSVRMYLLPPDGGEAQAISAEGVVGSLVTPDGKQLVARGPRGWLLCPLAGGTTQPIRGIDPSWSVLGWDLDGKRLRVVVSSLDPLSVFLLNPATGDKQPWKRVTRSASLDRAGLVSMTLPRFSRNGKSYAYHYHRQLSDLYVVDGLR